MDLTLEAVGIKKRIVNVSEMDAYQVLEGLLNLSERYLEEKNFPILAYDNGVVLVGEEVAQKYLTTLSDVLHEIESETEKRVSSLFTLPNEDVEKLINDLIRLGNRSGMSFGLDQGPPRPHSLFYKSFLRAMELGASDMHIVCHKGSGKAYTKFKVHGEFHRERFYYVSYDDGFEMLRAIFDTYGDKIDVDDFDDRSLQETTFTYDPNVGSGIVADKEIVRKLRFAKSCPNNAEEVYTVIRILNSKAIRLHELGLKRSEEEVIRRAVKSELGLILTSGPTGSGKTTTTSAACMEFSSAKSLQTIEDPIEISIPPELDHIHQNQLSGGNYAEQVKVILRQDIDAMLIGEIRDKETWSLTSDFARSGHLCISTVHANSPIGIIERLIDLGASPFELASSSVLKLLMGQRLEPVLCPHCRVVAKNTTEELLVALEYLELPVDGEYFLRNREGCSECNGSGIEGRQLVLEQIEVDAKSRMFIKKSDFDGWREHLSKNGHQFIVDKSKELVTQGLACPLRVYESYVTDQEGDS